MNNELAKFSELFKQKGIKKLTNVQEQTLDYMLGGDDFLALAPTGSGKTFAYALPRLTIADNKKRNSLVIIEPTNELALQVRDAILDFAKVYQLKVMALVGSGNRARQIERLKKETINVIIATPGRFFDMVKEKRIKTDKIESLVFDEFDEILVDESTELFSQIVSQLPETTQIAFFGATQNKQLDVDALFDREFIKLDLRDQDQPDIDHNFLEVANDQRINVLNKLLKMDGFYGLVFFNSLKSQERVASVMHHSRINFGVLNNQESKQSRQQIIGAFRKKELKVLLVSDIAARGLDFDNLKYIVNFEVPRNDKVYTHRAGRTGRMGAHGVVITLGNSHDFRDLKKILDFEVKRVYLQNFKLTNSRPNIGKTVQKNKNTISENGSKRR